MMELAITDTTLKVLPGHQPALGRDNLVDQLNEVVRVLPPPSRDRHRAPRVSQGAKVATKG